MIFDLLLWCAVTFLLYAVFKWSTKKNDYFEKRGISFLKPKPVYSVISEMFFNKKSMVDFMNYLYTVNPGHKVVGTFQFGKPMLILRDPEVIKQMVIKDFDHFEDHRNLIDEKVDILFGNSLFMLRGAKWRDMRATLSPAFTGSKMRQMFELVSECGEQMTYTLMDRAKATGKVDFEMKELFSKYANDVISSAAFGYKINSFEDPNNEFYLSGKKFMEFSSPKTAVKMMFILFMPKLASFFKVMLFDAKTMDFFRSMVLTNMESRQKQGIFRPDMINILMNVKNGKTLTGTADESTVSDGFATVEESSIGNAAVKRVWTDDELVAQCFLFFLAGFDTSSTLLSFVAYELCINPDLQERLYQEVLDTHNSLGGKRLTYDAVQKMKFMDMFISETLRYWPAAPGTDRVCVKDYHFDDGSLKFTVEKGTALSIPFVSLHHDEKYWDNPKKFNPDRFSEDNKDKIVSGTYLPFGLGPRNCIGSRFALMEAKAVIYYLLLNFKFEPNENSQIPIQLKKSIIVMTSEKGIHVALKLRN